MKTEQVPEPEYNIYGQIQCHRCGCYGDLIYPVHQHNQNGRWCSLCCTGCVEVTKVTLGRYIDRIGESLRPDRTSTCYLEDTA